MEEDYSDEVPAREALAGRGARWRAGVGVAVLGVATLMVWAFHFPSVLKKVWLEEEGWFAPLPSGWLSSG